MVVMASHFPSQAKAKNPELSSLEQRAHAQQHYYWRVRVTKALETLEREARRMLQLEEELGQFASTYYEVVGAAAERLSRLEQQLMTEVAATPSYATVAELPAVIAQCDVREARRAELKTRYRNLAKEIHPDRAMVVTGNGTRAEHMQTLNVAYQRGDLPALLKLEAEMLYSTIAHGDAGALQKLEDAVRAIERAADTYADGYRAMLRSPINELMLRAMQARLAGWNWMDAVLQRVERTIEEKERALAEASIAAIGDWRALQAVA